MPRYAYKAVDSAGRMIFGRLDALNPLDLEARLKRMQLDFIRARPLAAHGMTGKARISRRSLINFCFHLEQSLRAGVPMLDSLDDLRDSLENRHFCEVVAGLGESIAGGKTLSQAMAERPRVFDRVMVGLVRAGETSGRLPEVMAGLVESLKWQDELAAHSRRLLIYPAFMAVVVLASLSFMLGYLVPRMAGFIGSFGQDLPLYTRWLLAASRGFVDNWHWLFGLPILAAGATAITVRASASVRYRFDTLKLRLPLLGIVISKIALARFAGVLAMLYAAGIPMLDAVRTTEEVLGNRALRAALRRARDAIVDGRGISAAFQSAGLFPPLVIRMLRVGENTGRLDDALSNVAYFYGRDVRESITRLQAIIEPALTVTIGLVLGGGMFAVLSPLYDLFAKVRL